MTRIRVNPQELSAIQQRLSTVQSAGNNQVANIGQVRSNLDWQVTSQQGIDERLGAVQRRLQNQTELMGQYVGFLNTVNDRFTATDRGIRGEAGTVLYRMRQITAEMRSTGKAHSRIKKNSANVLSSIVTAGGLFGAASIATTLLTWVREWIVRMHEERGGKRGGRVEREKERLQEELRNPKLPLPINPPSRSISSTYGERNGRPHRGLDIPATPGTDVLSPNRGFVIDAGYQRDGLGHYIAVLHPDGHITLFAHLQKCVRASIGESVDRGSTIAQVGQSGSTSGSGHLHIEVIRHPGGIEAWDGIINNLPNRYNVLSHRGSNSGITWEERFGHTMNPLDYFPALRDLQNDCRRARQNEG